MSTIFSARRRYIAPAQPATAVPVILDTDMGGDVDDVGAIAVLNRLHNQGECEILAVICTTWERYAVEAVDVINTYFGNPDITIGRYYAGTNPSPSTDNYTDHLRTNFSYNQTKDNTDTGTVVSRTKLAAAEDNSVVYITIGTLQSLNELLSSSADGISALNGTDLFNQKVSRVHVMGGHYPSDSGSAEYNLGGSGTGIAAAAIGAISRPILFNGYEIGHSAGGFGAGASMNDEPSSNPIAEAYKQFYLHPPAWINGGVPGPVLDHDTWDPIAVFVGVRGIRDFFTQTANGTNTIQSNGQNSWAATPDNDHGYVVEEWTPAIFAKQILEPLFYHNSEPLTVFPADLSTGHIWTEQRAWAFDGPADAPPPGPWENGAQWAAAHDPLGGHVWRDAVNLLDQAYLDGTSGLVMDMDYNATHSVVLAPYLITYPDGGGGTNDGHFRATPTANGIYMEARIKVINPLPPATWFAFWTYQHDDAAGDPRGEVDMIEYVGINSFTRAGFTVNTHGGGEVGAFHGNADADGAYGSGQFIFPQDVGHGWGGDQFNDGEWHTVGLFWSLTEQRFYYDEFLFWTREQDDGVVEIHQDPQSVRLTFEAQDANPFGTPDETLAQSNTDGDFTGAQVVVDYVRVYERSTA